MNDDDDKRRIKMAHIMLAAYAATSLPPPPPKADPIRLGQGEIRKYPPYIPHNKSRNSKRAKAAKRIVYKRKR